MAKRADTGLIAAVGGTVAAVVVAVIMALPGAAVAQSSEAVGAKRDWSIFKQGSAADRQCWIVSQPTTSTASRGGRPVDVNRGDIFLMVAIRPGAQVKNEVSMIAGYPFRSGSSVTMQVSNSKFEMFTDGEGAWTDSAAKDDEVVAAMRRGANAKLTGTSSRGTQTVDTFSLIGFTAALEEARALCN
ncbi:MAG: invasion associated locus B family protein [Pseudomonadota bacterium]